MAPSEIPKEERHGIICGHWAHDPGPEFRVFSICFTTIGGIFALIPPTSSTACFPLLLRFPGKPQWAEDDQGGSVRSGSTMVLELPEPEGREPRNSPDFLFLPRGSKQSEATTGTFPQTKEELMSPLVFNDRQRQLAEP